MYRKPITRRFLLALLVIPLAFSGCLPFLQPVTRVGTAPTPVVSFVEGGVDNPDVYVDAVRFQAALLKTMAERDTRRLQLWMDNPVLTGRWRGEMKETPPDEALEMLLVDLPGAGKPMLLVKEADLKALMGGKDPLSVPRSDAGVIQALLVGGWGSDGRDEAVLFISRWTDNSLKLRGWMRIEGGFSGARQGGLQKYTNETYGYSFYLPAGDEVNARDPNSVVILGPGEGQSSRGIAFINVEPSGGRTAEQVIEAVKAAEGPGFNIAVSKMITMEDAPAYVVTGLPGQDPNRQLFMVRRDLLYRITFMPDDPQSSDPYRQMEDIYAMITNTLHFEVR